MDRWATFDCYGTLIDWNAGIRAALERLFGADRAPRLLERYHVVEPDVQAHGFVTYREVLRVTLLRLAFEEGEELDDVQATALADSLPDWPPFPEVPEALRKARERGWNLAILSNSDRDLIAESIARIGVAFDHVVVAEDVRSYKPAHGHWTTFFGETGAAPERHVHVAASLFHDMVPAQELGLHRVWVNRLGEPDDARPERTITDLSPLPEVLDELVPA